MKRFEVAVVDEGVELFSAGVVSRRLGIAKRTLWRMLSEGRFPKPDVRVTPTSPRWKSATLSAWVDAESAKCR